MASILIVDDHPTNREFLVTLLGYSGHRLLQASDGEQGLALARVERPDLIITDMVMPTMDGYEFAQQVRADPAIGKTQIIFYTSSYVVAETRRLAEACAVAYIIAKPAEPQAILSTVNAALNSKPLLAVRPVTEEFHLQQMRLLTDALARKVEELEAEIAEHKQAQELLAKLYLIIQGNVSLPHTLGSPILDEYLERLKSTATLDHDPLSPREHEVVRLVAEGRTNKEISKRLSVSLRTVERHRSSILKKLRLRNRAELVSYAVRKGILTGQTKQ